jgi:hypothetical protein
MQLTANSRLNRKPSGGIENIGQTIVPQAADIE